MRLSKPLKKNQRFVLITGVSKFSKVSIFSDLNNGCTKRIQPRVTLGYPNHEISQSFSYWLVRSMAGVPDPELSV